MRVWSNSLSRGRLLSWLGLSPFQPWSQWCAGYCILLALGSGVSDTKALRRSRQNTPCRASESVLSVSCGVTSAQLNTGAHETMVQAQRRVTRWTAVCSCDCKPWPLLFLLICWKSRCLAAEHAQGMEMILRISIYGYIQKSTVCSTNTAPTPDITTDWPMQRRAGAGQEIPWHIGKATKEEWIGQLYAFFGHIQK